MQEELPPATAGPTVLDQMQRWLATEVAGILERRDPAQRIKVTFNIKGDDIQPVLELYYGSLE